MEKRPRILVKCGGGFGDVLLATPVLKALKEKYPHSFLTLVTNPHGNEIVKTLSCVDEVVPFLYSYEEIMAYDREGEDLVYALRYEKTPEKHIVDAYALCAEVELASKEYLLHLSETDRSFAQNLLAHPKRTASLIVGVHRGPSWPHRAWEAEKFRRVLRFFKENYGAAVVEFSHAPEMYLGEGINLTGRTTVRQAAAVLAECDLLVCIDFLFLHLAGAVGTPVVAVSGCTDPDKRLPFNDLSVGVQTKGACRGCHHQYVGALSSRCRRDRIYCLEEVEPEEVIEEALGLLDKTGRGKGFSGGLEKNVAG